MTDITEFQKAIIDALEHCTFEELADKFEVSKSTIRRWGTGKAKPLPRTRQAIIEHCKQIVENR